MAISTDPNRPNSMKFNELSPGVQQNSVRGGGGGGGGGEKGGMGWKLPHCPSFGASGGF